MNIYYFPTSNSSYLEQFLQSGFTEVGLIDYFSVESLTVRDVLVQEQWSKVCEYAAKRTLVNKLKGLNNNII
jgi:hypothetical protein